MTDNATVEDQGKASQDECIPEQLETVNKSSKDFERSVAKLTEKIVGIEKRLGELTPKAIMDQVLKDYEKQVRFVHDMFFVQHLRVTVATEVLQICDEKEKPIVAMNVIKAFDRGDGWWAKMDKFDLRYWKKKLLSYEDESNGK